MSSEAIIWMAQPDLSDPIKGERRTRLRREHVGTVRKLRVVLEKDLDLLRDIRDDTSHMSIAWTRVLPEGTGTFNLAGLVLCDRRWWGTRSQTHQISRGPNRCGTEGSRARRAVDGYFVWSLLDIVEWRAGSSRRFGLV